MSRRRLRFEAMEKRQLLAGDLLLPSDISAPGEVRVVVTGGNMVVTGDIAGALSPDADESIKIVQVANNSFSVTGQNGTKVNGGGADGTVSFSGVTGSITIDLKGGNNVVKFGESAQQTVNRALTIRSGAGADTIEITNTKVNGILTIDAGAGTNNVTLIGLETTGNVSIKGTADTDTFTLTNATLSSGALLIDTGPGTGDVTLESVTAARGITIKGTTDTDTVGLANTTVPSGALLIDTGSGTSDVTLENVTAARGITIKGTTGTDTVSLTDTNISSGALSIDTGPGVGTVTLDTVTAARGITIKGTTGADTVSLTNTNISSGALSIDTGPGVGTVTLETVTALRGITIKGTTDTDTVSLTDTNISSGALLIDTASGTGTVTLDTVTALRGITIKGTTDADTVSLTNTNISSGALSIDTGPGVGTVTLDTVTAARAITIKGTTDTDTVSLTNTNISSGALSIDTGPGVGTVTLETVTAARGITIKGTTGADTVNLTNTTSNGTLTIDSGLGDNEVNVKGVATSGNVVIKGANGTDTIDIRNNNGVATQFNGTLLVDTGVGAGTVTLDTVSVARGITIKGTTDTDTVSLTNTNISSGALVIDTGSGTGTVALDTVTAFRGITIKGTTGNDTVNLTNTTSNGTLTIDGGAGDNTVNLLGVTATGNASIKGTTGIDTVTIEPILAGGNGAAESKFSGTLMIDLGTVASNRVTIGSVGPTVVTRDMTIKSPTASEKVSVKNVNVTEGRLSIEAGNVTPNTTTTAIELEGLDIKRDLVVVALYPSQDNSDTETMSLKGSKLGGSLSVNARSGRINVLIQDNQDITGNATLTAASFGDLTISSSPITGNVTIKSNSTTGSDNVNITGSQINGRLSVDLGSGANDTFRLSGGNVGKDVSIKSLATASSAVTIEGTVEAQLQFSGNVTITTGNGADDIKVKRAGVTGSVTVVTGAGTDDIGLKAVAASADIKIDAGLNPVAEGKKDDGTYEYPNLDRIAVVGGSARNVTIDGGDSAATTGPGASQILITGFKATGNLSIKGGNSEDRIGVGDAGQIDTLATSVNVIDEINSQLGSDNDGLLGLVEVNGTLTINTYNQKDHVWLHTVTTKSLLIDTSFNVDTVKIYDLTGSGGPGSRISVNLGNGNDELTLSNVTPSQFASRLIDGGVSTDTLLSPSTEVAANDAVFKNWEEFGSIGPPV